MNDFIFGSVETLQDQLPDTRSMVEQLQDVFLPDEAKAIAALAEDVSESPGIDMAAGVHLYSDDKVVITIGIHKAVSLEESSEEHF